MASSSSSLGRTFRAYRRGLFTVVGGDLHGSKRTGRRRRTLLAADGTKIKSKITHLSVERRERPTGGVVAGRAGYVHRAGARPRYDQRLLVLGICVVPRRRHRDRDNSVGLALRSANDGNSCAN